MAKRRRKWQRGTADMVSIGVGVILLAIVTAGTTAAMVYGREAMIREEHYKAAAYLLRGAMEEQQAELQLIPAARTNSGALDPVFFTPKILETRQEREGSGSVQQTEVTLWRDQIEVVDDLRNNPPNGIDFYRITLHARWRERDYAERLNMVGGIEREITMQTAVLVRAVLG